MDTYAQNETAQNETAIGIFALLACTPKSGQWENPVKYCTSVRHGAFTSETNLSDLDYSACNTLSVPLIHDILA